MQIESIDEVRQHDMSSNWVEEQIGKTMHHRAPFSCVNSQSILIKPSGRVYRST
jgi:hypothetical protein